MLEAVFLNPRPEGSGRGSRWPRFRVGRRKEMCRDPTRGSLGRPRGLDCAISKTFGRFPVSKTGIACDFAGGGGGGAGEGEWGGRVPRLGQQARAAPNSRLVTFYLLSTSWTWTKEFRLDLLSEQG